MKKIIISICVCATVTVFTGCADFFEQDSDHVAFAEDYKLDNATDTIYGVIGILNKMQKLADRTILLGEARGDLVDISDNTSADLREVALFSADDDNVYNNPRDYYAVINNCNYFLANVDTALVNSRNEQIFKREYAVVKGFRAWTYLQLALNYGSVPFFTTPILTKKEADQKYERKNIQEVCEWLIQDLTPLTTDEYLLRYGDIPMYGTIRNTDSRLFYFPISLMLGELNLWAGHYNEAAQWYYKYITTRNGTNVAYTTGTGKVQWMSSTWDNYYVNNYDVTGERYSLDPRDQGELITMIPADSIPSEGNFSQLRNIFNSYDVTTGEYHQAQLVPSVGLMNLSESQIYCHVEDRDTIYAPNNLENHLTGDLRLPYVWDERQTVYNSQSVTSQTINKYSSRNVHLWRRQMVWLHFAEALNRAGYPRFAYQILARGLSNQVIQEEVIPYYRNDSIYLSTFSFPNERYIVSTPMRLNGENMQGIHSRGSGWAYCNKYYQMPVDTLITDSLQQIQYQIGAVEDMIVNEGALEFAFEGLRFYDLMRVALRRGDPAFLANKVYGRRGEQQRDIVRSLIPVDLNNTNNWFLKWNGQIGIE